MMMADDGRASHIKPQRKQPIINHAWCAIVDVFSIALNQGTSQHRLNEVRFSST